MASRIVKALKNAKSSLKSQDTAVEEPEIVAVIPPPQGPKRSQPPPTPPTAKHQHQTLTPAPPPPLVQLQPSPPLSPVMQKLEETKLHGGGVVPEFEMLAELPDTSIARPRSSEEKKKFRITQHAPASPVDKVKEEEDGSAEEEGLGKGAGLGKELKEKKKKDPAVLVEIPKSPSAQAYEVAHSHKLQDQYFNPVFEDESRTPREPGPGGVQAALSPEKVAESLKAVRVAEAENTSVAS